MGIFDRFRRGKGKGKGEEPPPAPAPTPAPAPPPAGEAPKEKKRGLFGRLKDKVTRKKPPAAPAEEAPPAAPPAPPEGPPPGPPGGPMPEGPEEPEGPPEEEEKDYSDAPSSAAINIPGQWAFSKKTWPGVVKGTLSGQAEVIAYLKAIDEGREKDAVEMIVEKFDQGSGFASGVDLDRSTWTLPQM
ncbi:hypothetical protein [Streptomyces ipomoeae]|uniref:hypothetical protein n=1 Tax=Streptomyces ipomoeae TaxID=103232 RepID=UPI0029BB67CE|nr:hypothetical protein [Streptomyces ipomoeae]MDX2695939.1 hypothetical protein [Streptomyces ipomoeae]MDX2843379.1 hypothetical protein [Streptomyces ipomoeae]